jgi:hypothetical protein
LIQPNGIFGNLFDPGGDAIRMLRPNGRLCAEVDELVCAGQNIHARPVFTWRHSGTVSWLHLAVK